MSALTSWSSCFFKKKHTSSHKLSYWFLRTSWQLQFGRFLVMTHVNCTHTLFHLQVAYIFRWLCTSNPDWDVHSRHHSQARTNLIDIQRAEICLSNVPAAEDLCIVCFIVHPREIVQWKCLPIGFEECLSVTYDHGYTALLTNQSKANYIFNHTQKGHASWFTCCCDWNAE